MKELKREITFLDKEGHRARLDVEITKRNGYPEFSVSGSFLNSSGQCLDHIRPANSTQRHLIELWKEYHLKNVSKIHFSSVKFDEGLNAILDRIERLEKERERSIEKKTGHDAILAKMHEEGIEENMIDAVKAYIEALGSDDLKDFEESYVGNFLSDEDFARDTAENLGEIHHNAQWPHNNIDWEEAAAELMMDHTEINGFYFRNL